MPETLSYWGSWKGRVIKAISIDGVYSWEEIRDITGLSYQSLNQVLAELFDAKAIYKIENGQYRVNRELYKEYNEYFRNIKYNEEKKDKNIKITKDQQSNLKGRIDEWKDLNRLNISLKLGHFYLDGEFLDQLSKFLIKESQKQVLVVNPFVGKCNLSDALIQASKDGKDVMLVTRPPDKKNSLYGDKTDEYHSIIRNSGIKLVYNSVVHAKLMVIDRAVAIASSMNLTVTSTAGASWEAGIISVEENIVESVMDSISKLIETPESKTQ
jgi:hypothetical protein